MGKGVSSVFKNDTFIQSKSELFEPELHGQTDTQPKLVYFYYLNS